MSIELYRRMLPLFIEEAEQKLAAVEAATTTLALAPADEAARRDLARALHTIKGNAAMLGLAAIVAVAERMERVWTPGGGDAALAALHSGQHELKHLITEVAGDLTPA